MRTPRLMCKAFRKNIVMGIFASAAVQLGCLWVELD